MIYRIFNCTKFDNTFYQYYDARILNVEYFFNPLKNYVDFLHSLLFSFHVILNDVMTAHPLLNLSTFRSYGSFLSDF